MRQLVHLVFANNNLVLFQLWGRESMLIGKKSQNILWLVVGNLHLISELEFKNIGCH